MKKILISCMLIICTVSLLSGCGNKQTPAASKPDTNDIIILKNIEVDKDYLMAVNAADQFLGAWLMRDLQKGVQFITPELKNSLTEEQLFAFFVGTSNPHHQGFEIIGKERINDTTIRFNVWLYEYYTGENPPPVKRGSPYYIDVVKSSEYIWLVSNLPAKVE